MKPSVFKKTIALLSLVVMLITAKAQIIHGTDAKVTIDNNNINAGFFTPGFDGRNLAQQETTIAISPVNHNIIVIASNDQRMNNSPQDYFFVIGLNISNDGGMTWFNTTRPGFPTDTTAAGLVSPLRRVRVEWDPIVRFDAFGNFYLIAVAFQDPPSIFQVVYLVKYNYTPGTKGGITTRYAAANPPNFTYAFTTVIDRSSASGSDNNTGNSNDKPSLAIDTNPSSPGSGNIYVAFNKLSSDGVNGLQSEAAVFSRSTDGGKTFSQPHPFSKKENKSTKYAFPFLAVAPNGVVYANYFTRQDSLLQIGITRSDDYGQHFGPPVTAALFTRMPLNCDGLFFRTGTCPEIAVDDLNPQTIYITFPALSGSPANADIFVARSTNGGTSWEAPVKVNDDNSSKHQFFPTISVSHGAVHLAWYDLRNSPNASSPSLTNNILNVYYAVTNTNDLSYPAFSTNIKVSDVGQQPNCRWFASFGTNAFMGDYIDMDAWFDGTNHNVHIAWADNRDIPAAKADLDSSPDNPSDTDLLFNGRYNQNIYTDKVTVQNSLASVSYSSSNKANVAISQTDLNNSAEEILYSLRVFPIPTSSLTTISFSLPRSKKVSIKIFDVSGKLITTLVESQLTAGAHQLIWDAANVNAGIYILKMKTTRSIQTKKLVVVK